MTSAGSPIDAAIVVRNCPTMLRTMLDEQLLIADASRRPVEVVVWPSTKAAFRELVFPAVPVRRDEFLRTVVEDLCNFGRLPHGVPVWAFSGSATDLSEREQSIGRGGGLLAAVTSLFIEPRPRPRARSGGTRR